MKEILLLLKGHLKHYSVLKGLLDDMPHPPNHRAPLTGCDFFCL